MNNTQDQCEMRLNEFLDEVEGQADCLFDRLSLDYLDGIRAGFKRGFHVGSVCLEMQNERLREALEAIIERYEVANMLIVDDPVIEKAKKALEQ